jgi:hypothetical protein
VPPVMILGLLGLAALESDGHPKVHVLGLVTFGIVVTALVWLVSSKYARWAAMHSLTVSEEALLTNDGAEEVRTSYAQIDKLVLTRVCGKLVVARILYNNKFKESLLRYDDCSRLATLLTEKIPTSRVSERNWFHA